jgi:hypothetical protein
MTRDEIIERLMKFPNLYVCYELDLDDPNLLNKPTKCIYNIKQDGDRIIMTEY